MNLISKRLRAYKLKLIVLFCLLFLYLMTSIYDGLSLKHVTSLAITISVSVMLMNTYRKSTNFKFCWFFLGLSAGLFAVGDFLWIYVEPPIKVDWAFSDGAYALSNVFILGSAVMYFKYRKMSWDATQLLLDITAISTVLMTLLWIFFLGRSFDFLLSGQQILPYINFLAIIVDFLTIGTLASIYLSSPFKRFPKPYYFVIAGILVFVMTDLFYTYQEHLQVYKADELVDFLYIFAYVLLGLASIFEMYNPDLGSNSVLKAQPKKTDLSKRIHILYFAPVLIIVFRGFNFLEVSFLLFIVLMRQGLTSYTQALRNQYLLNNEMAFSSKLEEEVRARTKALFENQKKYERLSLQDPLTGLFNRRHLVESFRTTSSEDCRPLPSVLYLLDLDHFKEINDTYGHEIGDQVLIEMSKRLQHHCCKDTKIFRMGGDEFTILIEGIRSFEEIEALASMLITSVKEPLVIGPLVFNISISIGIARFPEDASELSELMKYADIAMYSAKSNGRSRFEHFTEQLVYKIQRQHAIQMALKSANFDEAFYLVYQPQFNGVTKEIVGVEALVRWKCPAIEFVSPAEFIPLAEECGVIVELGDWILRQAVDQHLAWLNTYQQAIRIGINVSPRQIENGQFVTRLERLLHEKNVLPRYIDIEITESTAMKSDIQMEELLTTMSNIGCSISIDDFGTGYSSLSYLKRFDIDRLKIAKELIDEMAIDTNSEKIVHAIILMSIGLGLKTIAEGVETEVQRDMLNHLGCDEIQGYLLSKPISAEDFESLYLKQEQACIS